MLNTAAQWLVTIAGALVAAGTLFVYLRKFGRWVVTVAQYLATLAQLPEAVRELADTVREIRDALSRQLDDHETRLGRLESAVIPQENTPHEA